MPANDKEGSGKTLLTVSDRLVRQRLATAKARDGQVNRSL